MELAYPAFFLAYVGVFILISQLWSLVISCFTLTQSRNLHNKMLKSMLHAKMNFFDSNPVGRILNRFSKDVSVADLVLSPVTDYFVQAYARVFSIFILTCILMPYLLIAIALLLALLLMVRLWLMRYTNQTMKIELLSRSPVSTQLGSTVSGLPSIRAY